jgi:hypothetical protein
MRQRGKGLVRSCCALRTGMRSGQRHGAPWLAAWRTRRTPPSSRRASLTRRRQKGLICLGSCKERHLMQTWTLGLLCAQTCEFHCCFHLLSYCFIYCVMHFVLVLTDPMIRSLHREHESGVAVCGLPFFDHLLESFADVSRPYMPAGEMYESMTSMLFDVPVSETPVVGCKFLVLT